MEFERVHTHTTHNRCKTYFAIEGDFDPEEISSVLQLVPFEYHKKGEKKIIAKGNYSKSLWSYGLCDDYDFETSIMMSETLEGLWDKKEELIKIRHSHSDVVFLLMVVPVIRFDESTPTLAPTMAIMKWCVDTGTEIVYDLYVSSPDDLKGPKFNLG